MTQMGWVSRGGSCGGGQRAATPGCEGASLCGMVWGVVGLLMGGGVRAVSVRPEASRYLTKKSPSSLQCYRFWPWAIAGRGEYPRRTGRNEQGLRDPPGNYGLSCSINISKKLQNCSYMFLHVLTCFGRFLHVFTCSYMFWAKKWSGVGP